jgi:hypothetical protein
MTQFKGAILAEEDALKYKCFMQGLRKAFYRKIAPGSNEMQVGVA